MKKRKYKIAVVSLANIRPILVVRQCTNIPVVHILTQEVFRRSESEPKPLLNSCLFAISYVVAVYIFYIVEAYYVRLI